MSTKIEVSVDDCKEHAGYSTASGCVKCLDNKMLDQLQRAARVIDWVLDWAETKDGAPRQKALAAAREEVAKMRGFNHYEIPTRAEEYARGYREGVEAAAACAYRLTPASMDYVVAAIRTLSSPPSPTSAADALSQEAQRLGLDYGPPEVDRGKCGDRTGYGLAFKDEGGTGREGTK